MGYIKNYPLIVDTYVSMGIMILGYMEPIDRVQSLEAGTAGPAVLRGRRRRRRLRATYGDVAMVSINPLGTSRLNFMGVSYGIYMEYIWNIYGIYMEYIWNIYGIYMEYIWNIYIYMVYKYMVYKYMEYIWNIYGIYMEYMEYIWNT